MRLRRTVPALLTLSLAAGDQPPREFRIFGAGPNASRKGTAVFDAEAARIVMEKYKAHGVDIMLDLEHLSLDDEARNFDPDARGWAKLELRNGELWAVDVRWTPDGEARLRAKSQRYISPAFTVDKTTKRVTELVNIAITAMPATDKLTPLVAAGARAAKPQNEGPTMKFNPKLLAALGLPEDADEEAVKAAMAECMKDPLKFAACMSAMANADDAGEGEGEGDAGEGGEGEGATVPAKRKDGEAGAGDAGGEGKPTIKKVTTEYRGRGRGAVADELADELVKLRAQVNGAQVRDLLTLHRKKLTPALETWATAKFASDPEGLADWLKVQPILASSTHQEKRKPGSGIETVKLTREDLDVCKQLGRDPVQFLKHKRELYARGNPQALTALIDEET